ncbi:MAG: hydantoinase B/oxoprolinase family protein [Alphaproteobacteria bacterium]|nr:hydantoinase B/oxoprolinase family protein [Alphaproteobacteria bacterium]
MSEDKVRLEILANRFQAIVDEMAQVVARTAHTVFIKETQDYGSVLVSPQGEVFAAPRRYGVLMMIGMPMDTAIARVADDVRDGDVFISNDPDTTGGMCTHLSDVFLWKPVFHEGRLMCWAWTFIHMSDVGGRVPGSIAPSSHEVYQEGIRLPPQKLFAAGVLNRTLLDTFLANTRTADQNWGDMKACLAGLATAERRVHELIGQVGGAAFSAGIDQVLDYAERQARRVIAHVPNGTYTYWDYLEADMVGLGLVRIKVALTVADGAITLDFTGTAAQVRAALNIPTFAKRGHWMLITGLVNWLCTVDRTVAYNAGLVRPIAVVIPKGTILNPNPGAAYGARYATSHKVCDVTIGALAQAVPFELPAVDSGQGSILLVSVPDFATGGTRVSVIQPIVGGSGARPAEDGVDGTMVLLNFLRNVPTEMVEIDMPEVVIRRYGLREDSGGPGKYRGGTGTVIEFETGSPYTSITSRCMERYLFPPPGRMGGHPGTTGYTLLNPGTNHERDLGKIDVLELGPGDALRIGTQGGGGFGDPFERPAERVGEDVANGLVSVATAREAYGVVCAGDGALDEAATRRLRADHLPSHGAYAFGPAREAHEIRWPQALEDAIAEGLADLPVSLAQFLGGRLREVIDRRASTDPTEVPALLANLRSKLGQRPTA